MITHGAPAALDAGPNLLKISKSAFWQKGAVGEIRPLKEAIKRVGEENAGAHQGHNHRNCINHRRCP
jgi:hypothetical protein